MFSDYRTQTKLQCKSILNENLGLNLDYYNNFLDVGKSEKLFIQLEHEINYFTGDLAKIKVWGRWHEIPRQQAAFGDSGLSYKFSNVSVPAMSWPICLKELRDHIEHVFGFKYNFVLVNRYRDGKDHIGYHRDDEKMLDKNIPIASVSLGQHRDFIFRYKGSHKIDHSPIKLNLEHGSLLMINPPTNTNWYHSLPSRKSMNGVRVNLTFRSILQSIINTFSKTIFFYTFIIFL